MPYYRKKRQKPEPESEIPYIEAHEGETPLDQIDTFIIPSRDERGGYSKVALNMTPYMYRQCQIIVHSRRFPYLEVSDLIRHAVYRHLRFCVSIRHTLPKHMIPALEAVMEVCRDNEFRLRVNEAFAEIDRQVKQCISRGDTPGAVRLINLLKSRLDGVSPSSELREFMNRLVYDYGYVIGDNGKLEPGRKQ
jgi:hypothetical protein